MKIKADDAGRVYTITLRVWTGGWNAGYGPDIFDDIECNFLRDECTWDEEQEIWLCSDDQIQDMIDFWEREVDFTNRYQQICATDENGHPIDQYYVRRGDVEDPVDYCWDECLQPLEGDDEEYVLSWDFEEV